MLSVAQIYTLHIVGGSRGAVASGRSYPDDRAFARRAPSPFDDPRSREVRTRRMSPPRYNRDDGPPMKRARGGPPLSRGPRGPRRRGGFSRRGPQSRRF